ncbi:hypothetical protein M2390_003045 [Mycetocola sp. BIGb0189]|uniref:RICIN domain-containing protein n=1 Tax=Mycetocola sp. BIGb0189 TaxID=2940604 RepID=UPI00216778B3|nr:ricin-type beta-trefoil lectin domain protein [Mycetocola sp. BIGb0189]MCS4277830.1 hypothetical protein [Mycetocola sp. BIGb0189]
MSTLSPSSADPSARPPRKVPLRGIVLTIALLALIAVVMVPLLTKSSGTQATATSTIVGNGRCLDVRDSTSADGSAIQLFSCNGSSTQKWSWETDGTVRNAERCLEVRGGSDATGALVQLGTCNRKSVQQRFAALPDGTVYSAKSAKCLAIQGTPANRARVGLASCDPAQPTQQWASKTAPGARYALSGGPAVENRFYADTPNASIIDRDGTFIQQYANAQYEIDGPREWTFITGPNMDSADYATELNEAVNPANPLDKNSDTTWRCNNSPTGLTSTYAEGHERYSQRNYCDLAGIWVDPDSGDWYGLVHNEFTPAPFGDRMHYDAIDYAVSRDQGKTWAIKDQVITSPYSIERGDTAAFPGDNYYYGDGDQRLFVDNASGYFYVFYASRTIAKPGVEKGQTWMQHVARAPISQKMTPNSWQKWYDGAWQEPGTGGKESNIIPADGNGPGYTAPKDDYNPSRPGSQPAQVAAGTLPEDSQLTVMNIAWSAYLGKYIGTPQNSVAQDTETQTPLHFYATDDLATQKWVDIGTVESNKNAAWYRWMLDSGNLTSGTILGKTFRSYCSYECSTFTSEYSETTIEPLSKKDLPQAPVKTGKPYLITASDGATFELNGAAAWRFDSTEDGFFTITADGSDRVLGVEASDNAGRAWGAVPSLAAAVAEGDARIGQQWSFQRVTRVSGDRGASTPTEEYRLVNRYSGLALSLSSDANAPAVTAPIRQWNAQPGATGDVRPESSQRLTFAPAP